MKPFYLLISCIAIVFIPAQNTRVFAQETMKPSRPTLKIVASPTDSIIAISYTVPESSFVNLSISGTVGGVIAIPVYEPRMPGEYTVKLNKKYWPQEVYTISIVLNHDRKRRRSRRFTHHAPDRQIASDEQLQQVWSQAISSMRFDPETAVKHWETLLENTDYEKRGAAFLYSCGPLLKVADSMRVHAQIDSAVKWVPRSSVYRLIAIFMSGQDVPSSYGDVKLYPSTALKYAKKAIASADDIPLPHRKHALCSYYRVLGHSYLAAEKLDDAEIAFQQALSIFGELPEHHTLVKNKWDGGVLKDLGMVKTLKRDYDGALQLYSDALVKNPYDTDLWNMLQRVYTLRLGTDEGYRAFVTRLEQRLPSKNEADTRSIIGRTFPDFSLKTIEGETINFADLKGQVVIVNFWGSWCGPCIPELSMLEKIHSEYSDAPVKVIAIHDMFRRGIFKDYLSTIQKIAEQANISFPMLYDTKEVNIAGRIDMRHTPTTFIIDQEGKIQYEEMGYVETRFLPQIKAIIEKLIAG